MSSREVLRAAVAATTILAGASSHERASAQIVENTQLPASEVIDGGLLVQEYIRVSGGNMHMFWMRVKHGTFEGVQLDERALLVAAHAAPQAFFSRGLSRIPEQYHALVIPTVAQSVPLIAAEYLQKHAESTDISTSLRQHIMAGILAWRTSAVQAAHSKSIPEQQKIIGSTLLRVLNTVYSLPKAERQKLVETLPPDMLFSLVSNGEVVYTSTYTQFILPALLPEIRSKGLVVFARQYPGGIDALPHFVATATQFGALDVLFQGERPEQITTVSIALFDAVSRSENDGAAVALLHLMHTLAKNRTAGYAHPSIRRFVEAELLRRTAASEGTVQRRFKVVAALYQQISEPLNRKKLNEVSNDIVPPRFDSIPEERLFSIEKSEHGITREHRQRWYFYPDSDGVTTYRYTERTLLQKGFVLASSTDDPYSVFTRTKQGVTVTLYMNKPYTWAHEGNTQLDEVLSGVPLHGAALRSHTPRAAEFFAALAASKHDALSFIFLGSCNGTQDIQRAATLTKAEHPIHMIASEKEGKLISNAHLLGYILDDVQHRRVLVWDTLWHRAGMKTKDMNYQKPSLNIPLLFTYAMRQK